MCRSPKLSPPSPRHRIPPPSQPEPLPWKPTLTVRSAYMLSKANRVARLPREGQRSTELGRQPQTLALPHPNLLLPTPLQKQHTPSQSLSPLADSA